MALKDEYLTIAEAAKKLGVTRQTMHRWVIKRNIAVEKMGRLKLIKKADLEVYATQDIRNRIIQLLITELRKRFQYEDSDKIEEAQPSKNEEMLFLVSKKDGTTEKLSVSDVNLKVTIKEKGVMVTFKVNGTVKGARRK